jgi:EAL domain-containing protein (putative c-di-GMP-specific phosphodiesterase class I)
MNLVKALIIEEGANPALIDAEITESVMMSNEDVFRDAFSLFKELGITVSIDDFGTGYSALGNLNKFPLTGSSSICPLLIISI